MEWMLTYFDPANPYCRAGAIFAVVYFIFLCLIEAFFARYYSKKCSFACEDCRNWACQYKKCDRRYWKWIKKQEKEN